MNLIPEDKDYMHETFMTVKECSECREKIQRELSAGTTNFAEIRKDLQYIKDRLDKKSKFNMTAVTAVIQAICTLLVTIIAAKLGLQ